MKKQTIKLNESQFNALIQEAVQNTISEMMLNEEMDEGVIDAARFARNRIKKGFNDIKGGLHKTAKNIGTAAEEYGQQAMDKVGEVGTNMKNAYTNMQNYSNSMDQMRQATKNGQMAQKYAQQVETIINNIASTKQQYYKRVYQAGQEFIKQLNNFAAASNNVYAANSRNNANRYFSPAAEE